MIRVAKSYLRNKHNTKRITEAFLERVLCKQGYRWMGRNPYRNNWYQISIWSENRDCSFDFGHYENLDDIAIDLYLGIFPNTQKSD